MSILAMESKACCNPEADASEYIVYKVCMQIGFSYEAPK